MPEEHTTEIQFALESDVLDAAGVRILSFEGVESISRLFEYQLVFTTQHEPLDDGAIDGLLAGSARLVFGVDRESKIHGAFREIAMLEVIVAESNHAESTS